MDSLRAQLAETQGALTERDKKYRQLKAEHLKAAQSRTNEKRDLEAIIARLESENLRLKGALPAAPEDPSKLASLTHCENYTSRYLSDTKTTGSRLTLKGQQDADGDDHVTIPHSKIKEVEAQYKRLADEVTVKTKTIKTLETKLAQVNLTPNPTPNLTPNLAANDEHVVKRWNDLREQIRVLSLDHLNQTFPANLVTDKLKDEFRALSPHWRTYASSSNITCFLFRALIWRYLLRYFKTPCRSCGREISNKVRETAEILSNKVSDAEYEEWRIRTGTLIHKVYPADNGFLDEVSTQIANAITPLVGDSSTDAVKALKVSLHDVVETTAELSAIFDRGRFFVLMSNEPKSNLMYGFPYIESLMEMRAKLGAQGMVDLMVTPSLLKREGEYSVLVKAEVIC
ncbi:hypothetical protein F4808DRAFT_410412 [Astrocystis sublimbata]|nr:hypothetical protein F4808DRAFT_410412 [Astrocystis sublimbata]